MGWAGVTSCPAEQPSTRSLWLTDLAAPSPSHGENGAQEAKSQTWSSWESSGVCLRTRSHWQDPTQPSSSQALGKSPSWCSWNPPCSLAPFETPTEALLWVGISSHLHPPPRASSALTHRHRGPQGSPGAAAEGPWEGPAAPCHVLAVCTSSPAQGHRAPYSSSWAVMFPLCMERVHVGMIAMGRDAEQVLGWECDTCTPSCSLLCCPALPQCHLLPLQVSPIQCPGAPARGSQQGLPSAQPPAREEGAGGEEGRAGGAPVMAKSEQFLGTLCSRDQLCSGALQEHTEKSICTQSLPHAPSLHPLFMGQPFPFREK